MLARPNLSEPHDHTSHDGFSHDGFSQTHRLHTMLNALKRTHVNPISKRSPARIRPSHRRPHPSRPTESSVTNANQHATQTRDIHQSKPPVTPSVETTAASPLYRPVPPHPQAPMSYSPISTNLQREGAHTHEAVRASLRRMLASVAARTSLRRKLPGSIQCACGKSARRAPAPDVVDDQHARAVIGMKGCGHNLQSVSTRV